MYWRQNLIRWERKVRKMKAEKASTTLKIPLNERQHGIIERGAKKYGISMSKYVRLLSEDSNVLKKKDIVPYIEELDELTKNDPCLKVNKSAKKHVKKNMDCLKELVRDDKEVFTDETCERGSVHRTGVTFSDEQYKELLKRAAAEGMDPAAYIKNRIDKNADSVLKEKIISPVYELNAVYGAEYCASEKQEEVLRKIWNQL